MTPRVLVVDDEDSPRMSVELALTMAGYSVVGTADGREAIQQIVAADNQSRGFDLLITDLKMPHMSGLELLDELNAMGVSLPTLVITAFADSQTIRQLSEKGCDDYYEKPLDPKTLTNRVGEIIKKNAVDSLKWEAEILPPNPFRLARLETAFNTILAVGTCGN